MPFNLQDIYENNSELLKLLTEHLPDMLWVKDVEGKYIYANKAICDNLLMAKDTNEPIGKGDVFFALREREAHKDKPEWHTFGELCFNSDQVVIDNNKAMKFEEYGNVKGKLMYLEVYKAPFYDKDGNTIGTVGAGRDITELKNIQLDLEKSLHQLDKERQKAQYQANHDSLTDLPNHILFLDRLQQSINKNSSKEKKTAVVFIDLDHFKEINDSFGHHFGDKILLELTKRFEKMIKPTDTLSRFGGDEFCVILEDVESIDYLTDFIVQSLESSKEPFSVMSEKIYVNMSLGISLYPHDGKSANEIFKNAEAAMYNAKKAGRGTYRFYDQEMTQKAYERVFLETSLRDALENDEFLVHYQPQIDALSNTTIGMEALVRWQHPSLGLLSPNSFIHLAEESGLIVKLDRIVIKKAIEQFIEWYNLGLKPCTISLNLSMKQIEEEDFVPFVLKLIKNKEYMVSHLEFEITETQIMKNPEKSIKVLQALSDLGIKLSIDDFGTGYSSLAYLKRLPINKLKIDKSFVDNLPIDAEDIAISKTIINLCESLNLEVIAEGVETMEQQSFLINNGCKNIQGYFNSRPLPANEMEDFLASRVS